MPRGDAMPGGRQGTGPRGQGPGTGRGQGTGRGTQQGRGQGISRGQGGRFGYTVICVCPNCGKEISRTPGTPCNSIKCPKCGTVMTRKN